eukprot:CAMPEP_0172377170 /NCGR_PEP_ID=MMETSP1060-20121228/68764_1 /TAXON_ID=37318 /ORGANISM="Pseudo-nitzschia pungens, Strain cf. cingulata" /LENGTH=750 /DNA_ID=CAMNT_0013104841 /DNA_START=72 /DNA_END=2325 /DNA_ORIENTATION=-
MVSVLSQNTKQRKTLPAVASTTGTTVGTASDSKQRQRRVQKHGDAPRRTTKPVVLKKCSIVWCLMLLPLAAMVLGMMHMHVTVVLASANAIAKAKENAMENANANTTPNNSGSSSKNTPPRAPSADSRETKTGNSANSVSQSRRRDEEKKEQNAKQPTGKNHEEQHAKKEQQQQQQQPKQQESASDEEKKEQNAKQPTGKNHEEQHAKKEQQQQQQQPKQQAKAEPKQKQQNGQLDDAPLPKWITDYVQWHKKVRAEYPGDSIFYATGPKAPRFLVRTCLGICGGLHDRVGQLPWDLYLAMRLERVLLMSWQRPRELENFLVPPVDVDVGADGQSGSDNPRLALDWRIPDCDWKKSGCQKFGFDYMKEIRKKILPLFDDQAEQHPGEGDFWDVGFERAMVRAGAPPSPGALASDPKNTSDVFQREYKYSDAKFLRHRILGHLDEDILEKRLEKEGYYKDEPHWKPSDLHTAPQFGAIWDLFFRPSEGVRAEIVTALASMNLLADPSDPTADLNPVSKLPAVVDFTAVHCRVRHPKAHPVGHVIKGKNARYPADKTGLPWEEGGPQRQFALETATKALVCAREVGEEDAATRTGTGSSSGSSTGTGTAKQRPIYFLSDSNDLVLHVAEELAEGSAYLRDKGTNTSCVYPPLKQVVHSGGPVVARNATEENAHIDRQKGREAPAYYGTIVDSYIARMARCVVYGIGFYAAFAAKVSGTDCAYLYAEEAWGAQKEKNAKICPNHESSKTESKA